MTVRATSDIEDLTVAIRSKNAGPTVLTIDMFCADRRGFDFLCTHLSREDIAATFAVSSDAVEIHPYPPALAIKLSMPRTDVAGSRRDRDLLGAQQHMLLLDTENDVLAR